MADQEQIDQEWDDEGVIPDITHPDTEYLIEQMTCLTLETVDPYPGQMVLDVGCGRALDLLSLESKGALLFGFDGSHVMISRAAENFQKKNVPLRLVCGSAEHLPYADQSFDKVFCKGAVDHFYDPAKAVREMIRILKPGGHLVISVANFNSLGFRLAKMYNQVHKILRGRELSAPHIWDKPDDHVYEFNYPFLLKLIPAGVRIDRAFGISMFWGFPNWGKFLNIFPEMVTEKILKTLDRIARSYPQLADVLVVRLERIPEEAAGFFEAEPEFGN